MGLRGNIQDLIRSYLGDREQYITLDNISSERLTNNCGVPQGSVLGPLLYTLHVLSLRQAKLTGQYYTFADDTVLVYSGKNIETIKEIINDDLNTYTHWLKKNKLKINTKKTKYMLFHQKNMQVEEITININGEQINKIDNIKYLGLVIDDKLNWQKHIDHLISKIVPMIGALYRCREYLNNHNCLLIYNAYFLSNLRYLIIIWGICTLTKFKQIQILQNKIIKILYNYQYRTPTEMIYEETKIVPIMKILKLEQGKYIYKVITNQQKSNTHFSYINNIHKHETRQLISNNLYLTSIRSNLALNNPVNRSIETYNTIPMNIRNIDNYKQYNKELKAHILEKQ